MKQIIFSLAIVFVVMVFSSCNKGTLPYTEDGKWVYRGDFDTTARSEAISFVVGDTAYVGFGIDGNFLRYNDLWAFDPVTFNWSQMASCPGVGRSSAVGFSINGEGYISTGYDGYNMLNDTWQFDPL